MKLKYNLIVNEVAGKMVAVAVGDDINEFNGFVKTNAAGAEILEILKNDVTLEEIVEKMSAKYPDMDVAELKSNIEKFIENLINEGVVN